MNDSGARSEKKASLFAWPVLLSLGLVSVGIWAHARFVENRRENIALVIGIPALVAGLYDIYLRHSSRSKTNQASETQKAE